MVLLEQILVYGFLPALALWLSVMKHQKVVTLFYLKASLFNLLVLSLLSPDIALSISNMHLTCTVYYVHIGD